MIIPKMNPEVHAVVEGYTPEVRKQVAEVRALIFKTAGELEGVGPLTETLKWGEPSYLTERPRTGTTIRVAQLRENEERFGLFVHCQTSLGSTWRRMFSDVFEFDTNRGILFNASDQLPVEELEHCIAMALTYHRK